MTRAKKSMLFTIGEAAGILRVDPQWLRDRIKDGSLTPSVRGGRGRGRLHEFSLAQLIGLTFGVWWYADIRRGRPMSRQFFTDTVARNSEWTQEEAERFVGLTTDDTAPYASETIMKKLGPTDPETKTHPDDEKHVVMLDRRIKRLGAKAKAKLSLPDPDRIMASLREAAGLPKSKTSKSKSKSKSKK